MAAWILSLMQLLVPQAPYVDTFPATAAAIEKVAHEAPLYDDDDGVVRTIAELVSLSFCESHFDPRAVDKTKTSFGLTQIDASNLKNLGLTSKEQLFDPETNLRAALKLMRISHRLCRRHPPEERLANYASGGGTCSVPEGLVASRRRMKLAATLLRHHPPHWVDASPALFVAPATVVAPATFVERASP
jgi:membrane-bound lytic murein transglycosylase MltF